MISASPIIGSGDPSGPARRARRHRARPLATGALAVLGAVLAACQQPPPVAKNPTPVLTQTVEITQQSPEVTLTGSIEAKTLSDLGFRLSGRIASRNVDVGDHVAAGQVLATLDTEQQEADVKAAEAGVRSAEATVKEAQSTFERQQALLKNGNTTRASFDDAGERLQSATASLETARASLGTARDNLANTSLRADAAGVITARNAEAGQVIEAAQAVFTLAQDGARDAVFDIYEALLARPPGDNTVEVSLVSDPSVQTEGTVREISPVIDPESGAVRVKIALRADLPPAMTLGAPVAGRGRFKAGDAAVLPWTALSVAGGKPVVWVVDPASQKASPRPISIAAYRTGEVVVRDGLRTGDLAVVAGMQLLRPGEVVEPRPAPKATGDQP